MKTAPLLTNYKKYAILLLGLREAGFFYRGNLKTHCIHGHKLEDNIYSYACGWKCKTCVKISMKRYRSGHPFIEKKFHCTICNRKNISRKNKHKICCSCRQKEKFKNPKNTPGWVDGSWNKTYYCIDCKAKISHSSWFRGGKRCLSCAAKKRQSIPENNPNWRGGTSRAPYPIGWGRTYKEQIRNRDDYKCQICGVPETECINALSVHHIDYNKENLEFDNLISLCRNCHAKTNGKREYWIKYFKGEEIHAKQNGIHCD